MSHTNLVCSIGIHLILLIQIGIVCIDGDLDLLLSQEEDLESLLLGGTLCGDFSLDFSLVPEYL